MYAVRRLAHFFFFQAPVMRFNLLCHAVTRQRRDTPPQHVKRSDKRGARGLK